MPLQGLNPYRLETSTPANLDDLRAYLQRELGKALQEYPQSAELTEQILGSKRRGVPLRRTILCRGSPGARCVSITRPPFRKDSAASISQYCERQFGGAPHFDSLVRPAVAALLAAREPLPTSVLKSAMNWSETNLQQTLETSALCYDHGKRFW